MKIGKKQLTLEEGIQKEWIITNGIGGYASSTILGTNTRRYHGLLVAPIQQPAKRNVILSKLDESIYVNDKKYDLFTNMCSNFISEGYKYQESFEKEYIPEFVYKVENVKIVKKIGMIYGHNTIVIQYSIKNDNKNDLKMTIIPIMNFRDFHSMSPNHNFEIEQKTKNNNVEIKIDNNIPVYITYSEGKYTEYNKNIFKNMYYLKEEERGFESQEDLCIPGFFEVNIEARKKKEFQFIFSIEEINSDIDSNEVFLSEEKRLLDIINKSKLVTTKVKLTASEKKEKTYLSDLIIASDNFIITREKENLHSVIAGYPWFLDWGRDTAISFEGLFLVTKRYELAKEVLQFLIKDVNCGLIPNGYSENDNKPLYNSADSSLLYFEQINKYIKYTRDYDFIKNEIYEKLKDIIINYRKRYKFRKQ